MTKFMSFTNKWVLALLLITFMAGCGSNSDLAPAAPVDATSNEITTYSLAGTDGVVTEGTTPKTIDVVMPFGTDLSLPQIATYTTTGASVGIDTVLQESGVTENVFLLDPQAPVIYTVTATDSSTATYDVNVTVAANDAAAMTTFSLDGNAGLVDETADPKTIDVVMPFGTDLSLALTATFVATGDVEIDTVLQESGVTTNLFPLSPPASATYTVIAADGIATATYDIYVTVAANDAALITSYSINGTDGVISEDTTPKTIAVVMPFGTDLSIALAATYATSPGASVMIDTTPQVSAETLNNFDNQVILSYTVTAADAVTIATYDVDVTLATAPVVVTAVDLGTAGTYAILAKTGVSTVPPSVVTGDVAVSPEATAALTGWALTTDATNTFSTSDQVVAPWRLYAADNTGGTTAVDLTTAVEDMGFAYDDAALRIATSADTLNVGAGTLTDLTLTPGVYEWGGALEIPTDLALSGSATDVWIFKVAGTLTMAAAKNVTLAGGALPENIFWQVSEGVTIGAGTHFEGIILGKTSITFGNLASINGRLLAQTAAVLDATTVTAP